MNVVTLRNQYTLQAVNLGVRQGEKVSKEGQSGGRSQVAEAHTVQSLTLSTQQPEPLLVGRDTELAHLHKLFAQAMHGERQIVFVTGEPGIGKTTLVDMFLSQIRERNDVRITSGQCVEQYGPGEAYMPLLEATTRLCRGPGREQRIEGLKRYAPSWLTQIPGLVEAEELALLQEHAQGANRDRMLREMAEAAELFSTRRGLVVVLEDLHWSDVATLDWLSYMARRREPAKLMILGTYRPVEMLASGSPSRGIVQELSARSQCVEVCVTPLGQPVVQEYVARRCSGTVPPPELVASIHRRTEGNPLFVRTLVDYLFARGVIRETEGLWSFRTDCDHITTGVPDTIRQLIEKQVERAPSDVQQVLEVASIVGVEFSAAEIAAGLQSDIETIELQCERLAHTGQFIRMEGVAEWPDGTLSGRYNFLHAVYREVIAARMGETRRIHWHRRVAERKEAAYGERVGEIAAELAVHFEKGRDLSRAVHYLGKAGETAVRRSAHQEAITLLTHGIELVRLLPETVTRTHQEVTLQVALGASLIAAKGYAATEVEQAYSRAYALCQQLEDTSQLFPSLWGLWAMWAVRAQNGKALRLAEQLLDLACQQQDIRLRMDAHWAMGQSLFYTGELLAAKEHFEQGIALRRLQAQETPSSLSMRAGQDASVTCLVFKFRCLLLLGYFDQASTGMEDMLAFAQRLSHPFSECYALGAMALFHRLRREPQKTQEQTELMLTKATEQGFAFWIAWGTMLRGWALAAQGQPEEGLEQLRQGLAVYKATGSRMGWAFFLALFVEAYARMGRTEEAFAALAEAFVSVEQQEEYLYVAELHRLKGELTLEAGGWRLEANSSPPQALSLKPRVPMEVEREAEEHLRTAIDIARRQQAKLWELRAAMSLAKLWQQQNKVDDARELLQEIYDWFIEGFDTQDLHDAAALLMTLGGRVKTETEKKTTERTDERANERQEHSSLIAQSPHRPIAQLLSQAIDGLCLPTSDLEARTSDTVFRPEGEYWTVSFAGETCRFKDSRGLQYIAYLLQHPHQEIHVITLVSMSEDQREGLAEGSCFRDTSLVCDQTGGYGDAGEILDPQARAAYKQRVRELQEELAEAQRFNDLGRSEQLAAEIDFLSHELASAIGLGGRARRVGSPAERARVNITRAIKLALHKINDHHPALGQHLTTTIKTGTYCSYTPDVRMPITWQG